MKTFQEFLEAVSATRRGRALGKISKGDLPQASKAMGTGGSGQRGGMTLTPVTSLGRDYKGNKTTVKRKYDKQVKKDRKAAALDRIREKM
jgi:DnaJ-domain-containing protein 1|tara:strand:- start:359 stop:628 length:270 start_codon:yes stop_codon:yes gene_type:complete